MEIVTRHIWLHLPETRKPELSRLLLGVLKEKGVDFYRYLRLCKSTKKSGTAITLQDSSLRGRMLYEWIFLFIKIRYPKFLPSLIKTTFHCETSLHLQQLTVAIVSCCTC